MTLVGPFFIIFLLFSTNSVRNTGDISVANYCLTIELSVTEVACKATGHRD